MTLSVPNLFSLLRLGLIPFFVIALLNGDAGKGLLLFVVAGVTDALDGYMARVLKQTSALGALLDPIADKLLLTTAYVMLTVQGANASMVRIPVWVTVLVIARDVLILTVALALSLAADVRKFPPTLLSKVNTVVQILGVILVLASGLTARVGTVAEICVYLVALLTLASGVDYIHRANRIVEQGSPHAPS